MPAVLSPATAALARDLADLCVRRGLICATAESCTGGLLGAALTSLAGSSRFYAGGVVAYANEVKSALLGVPGDMLAAHGAVSRPVAEAMALGVRRATGADVGLSTTGVAGPDGGSAAKPVGTVWIGWSLGGESRAELFRFDGGRDAVRAAAVRQALEILRVVLRGPSD
ncbi:MAG: nicotinamide-nucleotide amidohydrolase family protein [Desulfovibrionaceae bacterium]|nr:nicotinamide-nucleotide amidohydrolase family protein [Desulfovibrionaceae bacterium]